jgi:hypothetical protein
MASADYGLTMPMKVDNMGFMVDRYGRDCGPLQFVRELTTNAIEAIQRTPDGNGVIRWEIDEYWTDLTGAPKLSITDNGVGMTGEEMLRYLNQISSSVHEQFHSGNFGVGAKIAAATRNHAGLIYQSWVGGDGAQIHLWRDAMTGQYGMKQFAFEDGSFGYYAAVEDDQKAPLIEEHGTRVTLLGNDIGDNTVTAPSGSPRPSRWLVRYLNMRYFEFPEGVRVHAIENWREGTSSGERPVHGMKSFLERHSIQSGVVRLETATAFWWILADDWGNKVNSVTIEQGHVSALYQSELYEMQIGSTGVARLQQFGVTFGHNRVVIYLEPEHSEWLSPNTARDRLLIDGEPLPWADWAREFRQSLPQEIAELVEQSVPAGSDEYKSAIRERLNAIRDLMKLSRYRRNLRGIAHIVDGDQFAAYTGNGSNGTSRTDQPRAVRPHSPPRKLGDVHQLAASGVPAEEIAAVNDPTVHWLSSRDEPPSRSDGYLEDRAAKYLVETNQIHINADFRGFTDMIERWAARYEHVPGAATVVTSVVHEWFEGSSLF